MTLLELLPWAMTAVPLLALSLTLFNMAFWPRGRQACNSAGSVSILIPARNEEVTIRACVEAALAQPVREVVVYEDQSTDATRTILDEIAAVDPRLRIIDGRPLPEGWVGKPHACHHLAGAARSSILLFIDADVVLEDGAVERLLGLLHSESAQVVTAVPRQVTGTFVERLVLPLLHLTYTSWLPLPLIWRSRDPRFLAANGQILAVTREAYDATGGFEAVKAAIVDDMAFCQAQKIAGHRVVFADGHEIARCRMYRSAGDVWRGFSKNIYEGIGSPFALAFVVVLYLVAFVWPWAALAAGLGGVDALVLPAAVGVGANVLQRTVLALRHDQPREGILLHPLSVLALLAIAMNSWVWSLRGAIVWAGRTYGAKETRHG